jgi:putative hemolysin
LRRLVGSETFARDAGDFYHTLGGLAMFALGRIPRAGDRFDMEGVQFEIVDMDGNRVDKVMITRTPTEVSPSADASSTDRR